LGTAATHDDPGTGLHAMAATMAQTYGNTDENENDEDGNRRAPGNGSSTGLAVHSGPAAGGGAPAARSGGRYCSADFGVGWALGGSQRARAGLQ